MWLTALFAASLGVLTGPWLRGLVFTHSVAWQQPPRTHCPRCATFIINPTFCGLAGAAPIDGRCPCCGAKIGPPAGSVEIVTTAIITALTIHAPSMWVLAAWMWLALLGIALAIIDANVRRLPDPLTRAVTCGVVLLLAADAATTNDATGLRRAVICAAGLGGVYLIAILTPVGMGRGDGHLALSIGLVCGHISVRAVWVATVASIVLAGGYVVVGRLSGTLRPRSEIAFGPFMLAGALTVILLS